MMQELLLDKANPCLHAHVWAVRTQNEAYLAALSNLINNGTISEISSASKAKVIAALHICSEQRALAELLPNCEATEIEKALSQLDRPRKARQMRQKIQRIENENPHFIITVEEEDDKVDIGKQAGQMKRKRKIDAYRRTLRCLEVETHCNADSTCKSDWCNAHLGAHKDSGVREQIESASVSGSLARKARSWAKKCLKADFLEYVMLCLPKDAWKRLANLVHFAPSDFAVPYFLADVFGEPIPGDCFVAKMRELAQIRDPQAVLSTFFEVAETHPASVRRQYSFLRTQPHLMTKAQIVEWLTSNIPIETVLWFFEEQYHSSRLCQVILEKRLRMEENVLAESLQNVSKATYGKLMERILKFQRMGLSSLSKELIPLADNRLDQWKEKYSKQAQDIRVAVFGDASASMQRAIEAATIFASMVSTCLDGELSFFSDRLLESPHKKPKNVFETLAVCSKIRANNCTALAAALWPYYEKRDLVDLLVMVTDEGENTSTAGYRFANLLAKYKECVNPNVKLVVVCVGAGDRTFRNSLAKNNISYKTVIIDDSRPDLTKFDGLIEQLASIASVSRLARKAKEEERAPIADDFVVV